MLWVKLADKEKVKELYENKKKNPNDIVRIALEMIKDQIFSNNPEMMKINAPAIRDEFFKREQIKLHSDPYKNGVLPEEYVSVTNEVENLSDFIRKRLQGSFAIIFSQISTKTRPAKFQLKLDAIAQAKIREIDPQLEVTYLKIWKSQGSRESYQEALERSGINVAMFLGRPIEQKPSSEQSNKEFNTPSGTKNSENSSKINWDFFPGGKRKLPNKEIQWDYDRQKIPRTEIKKTEVEKNELRIDLQKPTT